MVEPVVITILPEVHDLYEPPAGLASASLAGALHLHQVHALTTTERRCRLHAPTGTGKSRAAAFFAVGPFHRGEEERIQATFAYPTNLLTRHQFEEGLVDGLMQNLGYEPGPWSSWPPDSKSGGFDYRRMRMPTGGDLVIAKVTGADVAEALASSRVPEGKADLLEAFLDWLNLRHNFLVASPDLLAYAAHERYGSRSFKYHEGRKLRLHSLLRGRTLVLDEYHQYDAFTLVNLERLVEDAYLAPSRLLLLSATKKDDYFPGVPELAAGGLASRAQGEPRVASRHIRVEFHFTDMPPPEPVFQGLHLYIHNSVVENRRRCASLRRQGVPVVQWDGTRKDDRNGERLVLGTSAVEVGLDLDADLLVTEWNPAWMMPEQITQRIGRVGRRKGAEPAVARIYVPSATGELRRGLEAHRGQAFTKDEFHGLLGRLGPKAPLSRGDQVSAYYSDEGTATLRARGFLEPTEELAYSFRPPGSQGLFLDRCEREAYVFLYDKTAILNRYDTTPPMPDDYASVHDGWRRLCDALGIDLEQDLRVIRGERSQRGFVRTPRGLLDELHPQRSRNLRKYYLDRPKRSAASSRFI